MCARVISSRLMTAAAVYNPYRPIVAQPLQAARVPCATPFVTYPTFRSTGIPLNTVHYGLSCRANAVGESPLFCWHRQFRSNVGQSCREVMREVVAIVAAKIEEVAQQ